MKFWKGNSPDAEINVPENHVASMFWQSPQGRRVLEQEYSMERGLRDWLTDPAGFNASWLEADFSGLDAEVLRLWPRVVTAEAGPPGEYGTPQ